MPAQTSSIIFMPAPSPHPGEPSTIQGILEQLEPERPTQDRKLALVLHGLGGYYFPSVANKDHLFLKQLASTLPMDTFRFDFRGYFESPGIWRQNKMEEDVLDLRVITDYLKTHFGYQIDLVISHSCGAVLTVRWICTSEDGKKVSGFVIVSATYRIKAKSQTSKIVQKFMADKGFHLLNRRTSTHTFKEKLYREDFVDYATLDNSLVDYLFPQTIDVLIIQGLKDEGVSVYNAVLYAKALSKRSPGTCSLHLMEHADHTYTGQYAEVVQTIVDWWDSHSKGKLSTGIWMGPERQVKGKL
ncbi:ectomycorrhiza-regulated esterase [Armillaria luteobubalina]|uniref:Ectomycorrhiza-regulated esterase n=1 Tax=Armillaria luteobubalina TaxID=153913 RepID=A0AA39UHL0_9AGAR|nr:ectomycorrhiza-regulated esterase [Armillaria luteobubalina]